MDITSLKDRKPASKVKDHLNVAATVARNENGSYTITIPSSLTSDHVYESQTKDKDGNPKKTPMAYVMTPRTAKVTLDVTQDGVASKVTFRLGGFSMFVEGVE
jgi:hypothetical protein